jgi:hypothetical protein
VPGHHSESFLSIRSHEVLSEPFVEAVGAEGRQHLSGDGDAFILVEGELQLLV